MIARSRIRWFVLLCAFLIMAGLGCSSDEPDVGVKGASGQVRSSQSVPDFSDDQASALIVLSESIDPVRFGEGYPSDIPITAANANEVTELVSVGKGALQEIVWSRNGQRLVALGTHSVYVFDASDWQAPPRIFQNALPPIAISSDGSILAARTSEVPLVVWGSDSGVVLATPTLPENSQVIGLAFSPDDDEMAALDTAGNIFRWETEGRSPLNLPNSTTQIAAVNSLHFHANGGLLGVGLRESEVVVRDVDLDEVVLTFQTPDWYRWYEVSADGSTIMLPIGDETERNQHIVAEYQLFDTLSGEDLGTIPAENIRTAVDARQNIYLSVDQGALEIHDIPTHRLLEHFSLIYVLRSLDEDTRSLDPHVPFIPLSTRQLDLKDANFSPDGSRIVLSYDSGEIVIIHLDSGEAFSIVGAFSSPFYDAWLRHDGNTLVAATAHSIDLWDLETRMGSFGFRRDPGSGLDLTPDGTAVAVGENSIMVYDLESFIPRRPLRSSGRAEAIMFDELGARLAWITDRYGSPRLHIRNLVDQNIPIVRIPLEAAHGFVPMMAFSPSGDTIAAFHGNGNLSIWDIESITPMVRLPFPDTNYHRLTYTPDGKAVAFSAGVLPIRIVDIESGNDTILADTGYFVLGLVYSPDGTVLAVGGIDSILLLDTSSGDILATLGGLGQYVEQLRFSPDGNYLISASTDGSVRLWGVPHTE